MAHPASNLIGPDQIPLGQIVPEESESCPVQASSRQQLWLLAARSLGRVVDIVTPPVCLKCREPLATHDSLCAPCWTKIDFIRPPLCDRLGIPLPYDSGAGTLSAQAVAAPPVYSNRPMNGF